MLRLAIAALVIGLCQPALGQTPNASGNPMNVLEFLVDADSLDGRVVAVHGVAACMGADICYLYASMLNPMQSVTFNPKALPRDDRKRLLECGAAFEFCSVTIVGRVHAHAPVGTIVAQSITW